LNTIGRTQLEPAFANLLWRRKLRGQFEWANVRAVHPEIRLTATPPV